MDKIKILNPGITDNSNRGVNIITTRILTNQVSIINNNKCKIFNLNNIICSRDTNNRNPRVGMVINRIRIIIRIKICSNLTPI